MSKSNPSIKLKHKKSVVRYPELPKPKTKVLHEHEPNKKDLGSVTTLGAEPDVELPKVSLQSPKMNSVFKLVKKIESIENVKPKKFNNLTELDRKKSSVVIEKSTKQVNFPHNRVVFKDLIPLTYPTESRQVHMCSKEFTTQKDVEPVLGDYFTPKVFPEYCFQVPVQQIPSRTHREFDGLKLYRTMRCWDN